MALSFVHFLTRKSEDKKITLNLERNRCEIVNYFITWASNAITEANNSIINAFMRNNRGTRNLDFFYFRLSQFLS